MRVVMFTAIKGGVGVSTLVLMLAKALAKRGAKVTLVDMDVTGYISGIAGIHDKGLLAQVVDGENLRGTHINKVDGIQVLKFLGDGMRFFDDIEKLRRVPDLLNKLVAEYSTAVSSGYDYVIIDAAPCFLELVLKNPFISYWLTPPASFRIYVTDDKKQSISATIRFIKRVEDYFTASYPFAVLINKVHHLEKSIEVLEELREDVESTLTLAIPFMPELLRFSGRLDKLPTSDQIEALADFLVSPPHVEIVRYFAEEVVPKEKYESGVGLYTDKSILLVAPPGGGGTRSLSSVLTRLSHEGELVVIKNQFIERRFYSNEFIVSPRYNFLRFEIKNINDIYRLAKRLGEEVLRILTNKRRPVVVLINEAELGPESPCCDVITQKREFWRTFLRHLLENRPELRVVLVCEDATERCEPLGNVFETVVRL